MVKENDIHFLLNFAYKVCIFGLILQCHDIFLVLPLIYGMIDGTYGVPVGSKVFIYRRTNINYRRTNINFRGTIFIFRPTIFNFRPTLFNFRPTKNKYSSDEN